MRRRPKSPSFGVPRFSLRLLLAMVTLAAILLAGWSALIEPYRRQASGFDRLNDLHPQSGVFPVTPTMQPNVETKLEPIDDSWHRTLVELAVGQEAALKIRSVQIPKETSEEDLQFIVARMKFIISIDVSESDVSEDIARSLASLPELERLVAVRSNLGGAAIAELSQSESIRTMQLTANPFGDESVVSLGRMKQLDEVFLRWSRITPKGVEALRAGLPDCSIWFQARAADADNGTR